MKLFSSLKRRYFFILLIVAIVVLFFYLPFQKLNKVWVYRAQIKLSPKNPQPYWKLATILRRHQDYQEAIIEFSKMKDIKAEDLDVNVNAQATQKIKKFKYFILLYEKEIELDPQNVEAYFYLADLYRETGLLKEAFEAYLRLIRIKPNYTEAHLALGALYSNVGNAVNAVLAYNHALRLAGDNEDIYLAVIAAYNAVLLTDSENLEYRKARTQTLDQFIALIKDSHAISLTNARRSMKKPASKFAMARKKSDSPKRQLKN